MTRFGFSREQGDGAQPYYRGDLPAQGLRKLGHDAFCARVVTDCEDDASVRSVAGMLTVVDIDARTGRVDAHPPPEVLVLRTWVGDSFADAILEARATGQLVFYDIDDDVWHLPEWNPARRYLGKPGHIDPEVMAVDMAACSGVLASTPALAVIVVQELARRGLEAPPVHVCRAGIDVARYVRSLHLPHGPLRVAWLGTTTYRGNDLALAVPALKAAQAAGHEVWHLGAESPRDFEQATGLRPDEVRRWRPFSQLPDLLQLVDVAVIPAVDDAFNACRSANTGFACVAAGLTVYASPTESYQHLAWRVPGVQLVADDAWGDVALEPLDSARRLVARTALHNAYGPKATARQYLALRGA